MSRSSRGLHELYSQDPERADALLWGRRADDVTRRGFLRQGGLAAISAALGAAIPFARFMPAGLIPAAWAQADAEGAAMKVNRNDPCPCGSGRKYKHCCLVAEQRMSLHEKLLIGLIGLIVLAVLVTVVLAVRAGGGAGSGLVWSEEHQHWHREP